MFFINTSICQPETNNKPIDGDFTAETFEYGVDFVVTLK